MKITEKEERLLINIAENEYAPLNGAEPNKVEEAQGVWTDCLDGSGPSAIPPKSIGGIMASLNKKGLAYTDGKYGETCGLTETGFV